MKMKTDHRPQQCFVLMRQSDSLSLFNRHYVTQSLNHFEFKHLFILWNIIAVWVEGKFSLDFRRNSFCVFSVCWKFRSCTLNRNANIFPGHSSPLFVYYERKQNACVMITNLIRVIGARVLFWPMTNYTSNSKIQGLIAMINLISCLSL